MAAARRRALAGSGRLLRRAEESRLNPLMRERYSGTEGVVEVNRREKVKLDGARG